MVGDTTREKLEKQKYKTKSFKLIIIIRDQSNLLIIGIDQS